jgi:hypothetical protein
LPDDATPDWESLRITGLKANNTAEGIKKALPIAYVLQEEGHPVQIQEGKAVALCPFHDDTTPSLDVYGDDQERWGCYPCGAGGDVFDLIERLTGIKYFPTLLKKAQEYMAKMPDGWTPPKPSVRKDRVFDHTAAREHVEEAHIGAAPAVGAFLQELSESGRPGLGDIPGEWLHSEFLVGVADNRIIIPVYRRNRDIVAYKHRTAGTKAMSAAGSSLTDVFYGEWRDTNPTDVVVLTEGESDTWAASYHLPEGYIALGLPAGAGAHPKQAPALAGREVIVAFDGDASGRMASLRWAEALRAAGADVSVCPLPEGADLASLPNPAPYILNPRPLIPAPDGITTQDGVYVRPGAEVDNPLSNWSLDPKVELLGTDGARAYEGVLLPSGEKATISSYDLASKGKTIAWSLRHGGAWYGVDRDAQQLLGLLQASGPFLTPGAMSTVAGYTDGHFIWPDWTLGPDNWKYVPPPNSVHLEERMFLAEGMFSGVQVNSLRDLHLRSVMDPILAWLAIVPLRALLRQFPILAVTGASGSGKTTLLETILGNMTGTLITTNLTSTTPHALFSFVGSTNGFPVWFDEYRPGARRATMESLQQVIRDAYTGQSSSKGGMGEKWSEVTTVPAIAPLVLSGEDAFHETSHVERMILVNLPRKGKNPKALEEIRQWEGHGLPLGYLRWLLYMLDNELVDLTITPSGPKTLPSRARTNLGILDIGWRLLSEFTVQYGGEDLGESQFGTITADSIEASDHDPIKDAILWALEMPDGADSVLKSGDGYVHIRIENFVQYVQKASSFTLPGGAEAIRRYIMDRYEATQSRPRWFGTTQVRAYSFNYRHLESEEPEDE